MTRAEHFTSLKIIIIGYSCLFFLKEGGAGGGWVKGVVGVVVLVTTDVE